MKKLLLGTTLLAGLAGPALATGINTIAIDQGLGENGSLAITQTGVGNTVSADGTTGSGAPQISLTGPWNAIAITQSGGGGNKFKGTTIASHSDSTTASLNATYAATSTGTNTHSLTIGVVTSPTDPTVVVNVANATSSNNLITDSIDAATLAYNLGLSGGGALITNTVSGTSGSVTLTESDSGFAGVHNNYGVGGGNGNTVTNTLAGGSGDVVVKVLVNGGGNTLINTVTTDGLSGGITLNQGGTSSTGIVGSNNTVHNYVGVTTPVGSFVQTLYVDGSNNSVVTHVDGAGLAEADVSVVGDYVDYALTSAGGANFSNVSLTGVGGISGTPDVVRVEQTATAGGATATLTVNGGSNHMGNLTIVPGTYSSETLKAGVAVYQNTANASTNAIVTASGNGYTALFKQ